MVAISYEHRTTLIACRLIENGECENSLMEFGLGVILWQFLWRIFMSLIDEYAGAVNWLCVAHFVRGEVL